MAGGSRNMTQLRLWSPDEADEPETSWEQIRWSGDRTVPDAEPRPHKRWRFSRWFREYWVPWGLCAGDDPARDKTIWGYYDACRWAVRIAGDPLLEDISTGWLNRVHSGLTVQTWTRAKTHATARPLSSETQAKLRRSLATCLREMAWQGLIPAIRTRPRATRRAGRVRQPPKPAYTIPELRRIVAYAETMPVRGFSGPRLQSLWRCVYGLGFYTGIRREALLSATWAHVVETDGVWWLCVPAEICKDSEPWEGPLYRPLVTELLAVRGAEDGRLVPWPHRPEWLLSRHKQICRAVGLSGRGRDLHGLKRSHLAALADAGFDAEKRSLALLAGHSDLATTFHHYTPIARLRSKYIPTMPAIW